MSQPTLDAPVRALFEAIAGPASRATPDLDAVGAALSELARDLDYLVPWIERLGDVNGMLPIHAPEAGPRLAIVHRTAGNMGAVHDHGTSVGVCPVTGLETHRRYHVIRTGGEPRLGDVDEQPLEAGHVVMMLPPDDVHAHGHLVGDGSPAYVLILTGDDQYRYTRNEWHPATGRHRVLMSGDRGRWLESEPMPG